MHGGLRRLECSFTSIIFLDFVLVLFHIVLMRMEAIPC